MLNPGAELQQISISRKGVRRAWGVHIAGAERRDRAGCGVESMPPDTRGVICEQMNRDRCRVGHRPHKGYVFDLRKQRVELTERQRPWPCGCAMRQQAVHRVLAPCKYRF